MSTAQKALRVKDSFSKESSLAKRRFFNNRITVSLPDLIEVQKDSYQWFWDKGLKELLAEINPIADFTGKDLELKLSDYYLDEPKYSALVAKNKNISYEAPLRAKAQLIMKTTGEVKEQEISLGDFPLMTERGTFIINGVERVVVSQLIRSPGVFFTMDSARGRRYYGAKIIPNRGAWLEIETDVNNVIYVKIDRNRKVAMTSLLRAFGFGSDEEIRALFADIDTDAEIKYLDNTLSKDSAHNEAEGLREVYRRIRPGDLATTENARELIYKMFFSFDRYDFGRVGRYKMNQRFNFDIPIDKEHRVLRKEDLIAIIREIIHLNNTQEAED